jgi:hypothetical protein
MGSNIQGGAEAETARSLSVDAAPTRKGIMRPKDATCQSPDDAEWADLCVCRQQEAASNGI